MAVIYARQSLDRKQDGAAVGRQLEECRALAAKLGLSVDEEIVDNDRSATKGERPGYRRLVKRVEAGEVDAVIAWHTDRLYRYYRDLIPLLDRAKAGGLLLRTVTAGDVDLNTPSGRMVAGVLATNSQYEMEHKAERQVAANEHRAKEGVWQFSRRPYGYRRNDNGKVVIVPEEVAVLKEGYRRVLSGESAYAIVADWNARGITAQSGKAWSVTQLRERLANPHYAGFIVYDGAILTKGGERVVGKHKRIVSPAKFDLVAQGAKIRAARRTHDNRTKYLLSGIALCGVCGERMFARPEYRRKGGKVMTYQCTSCWGVSRSLARVDEWVESIFVERLSRPDAATLLTPKVDVAPLMAEAADLRERRGDVLALMADGTYTRAEAREQADRLRDRINELEERIVQAQGSEPLGAILGADDVAVRWNAAALVAKRDLIRALADVTVRRQANTRVFDHDAIDVTFRS